MSLSRSVMLLAGVGLLACAGAIAAPPEPPAAGGGPSSSEPRYDPAAEYQKGIKALQEQRFQDALKSFERVLDVSETDASANYYAGRSAVGLEDFKTARKYYERAIKAKGDLVEAHRDLGVTYLKLGERAQAEGQLGKLKDMQQKCGSSCTNAKEISGAVEALTAALGSGATASRTVQPSLVFTTSEAGDRAYVEAVGFINEKRFEEAIASLETSMKAIGPHPDILTYLGFANRKLQRFDKAEAFYRSALAVAPEHRAATEYYGELMVERGDLPGARIMLAKLESSCAFGCAEADELRRWIDGGSRADR